MNAKVKKAVSIVLIAAVTAFVWIFLYSLSNHVSIGGESYSKKSTWLNIDANEKDFTVKKLNKFTKLEHLTIDHINDEMLGEFGEFDNLKELYIYYSKLSGSLSKLGEYQKLGVIAFHRSTIDLKNFNSTAEYLFFDECKLTNIAALTECSSLLSMEFESTSVDDYIVPIKEGNNETKYALKDSSVFEGFNSVKVLDFENIQIEDIAGILKMKELKVLKVSEDNISAEFITQLKGNGIEVEFL